MRALACVCAVATGCVGTWSFDSSRSVPLPPRVDQVAKLVADRATAAPDGGLVVSLAAQCGRDTVTREHRWEREHWRGQMLDGVGGVIILLGIGSGIGVGGGMLVSSFTEKDPQKRAIDAGVGGLFFGGTVVGLAIDGLVFLVNSHRTIEEDVGPVDVDHHVDVVPCASPPKIVRLIPPWSTGPTEAPFTDGGVRFPIDWLAVPFDPTDTDRALDLIGRSWTVAADGWTETKVTTDGPALLAQAIAALKALPEPKLDAQLVLDYGGQLTLQVTNAGQTPAYGVIAKVRSSDHVMGRDDLAFGLLAPGAHASADVTSVEGESTKDLFETVEWEISTRLGTWRIAGQTTLRIPAVP
jgi:hypothetical protein